MKESDGTTPGAPTRPARPEARWIGRRDVAAALVLACLAGATVLVLMALCSPAAAIKPGLYLGAGVLLALALARTVALTLGGRAPYRRLSAAYAAQGLDLAQRVAELEWLRAISQRLTEARTLDAVLDAVYEGVREGLGYDRVGVNLFDYEAGVFEDLIGTDAQGRKLAPRDRSVALAPDSPIWRFPGIAALLHGAPYYYTEDAGAECPSELHFLFDGLPRHNVMVPLRTGERVTGMISVDNLLSGRPIGREAVSPLLSLAGQVGMAVENARLLERERDERSRLAHLASTDALTGLPNRSLLHERLTQALRAASRGAGPLALLLMDLDRFKEVNDTLGHDCGDRLLQEVAARLRRAVRATDTVARLGGDEFAVLLPGADAGAAQVVAGALLEVLETPIVVEGQALSVGASVGIALHPEHGHDGATLLRRADVAMYVAKRGQLGQARYDTAQDGHDADRLALVAALHRAVTAGDLRLHYQPKVEVLTGSTRGVEALVRWTHPERGAIPPDVFIPLAEQTGLIDALTRWVLGEALGQCARWDGVGISVDVAVNLSLRNLRDPTLVATVADLLARHGLPPGRLCLELTESVVMADVEGTRATLERLAAMGVRLAIDDFGTGYSSLAYLSRLPVQELKIDRSFVRRMAEHGPDATIVASTIGLGHSLGLAVVTEGVEDAATWRLLGQFGADTAQGYYLARPLPAEEIEPWLRQAGERAACASA